MGWGKNDLLYRGVCPACKADTSMCRLGPKTLRLATGHLIRAIGFTLLRPVETAKRTLAMRRIVGSCACKACSEELVVCPHCNAAMVDSQLNLAEAVYCPNCSAFLF